MRRLFCPVELMVRYFGMFGDTGRNAFFYLFSHFPVEVEEDTLFSFISEMAWFCLLLRNTGFHARMIPLSGR